MEHQRYYNFRRLRLLVLGWTIFNLLNLARATNSLIQVLETLNLGPQLTPDLTNVSRDGGHSVMINGNVVWLYDDTECFSHEGKQLSFVSNTAAYAADLSDGVTSVQDFGVELVDHDSAGKADYAILEFGAVGDGGWIPFIDGEVQYNSDNEGKERIAICRSRPRALIYGLANSLQGPGSAPIPTNQQTALLYCPLVYVDTNPENPAKKYIPRGMTLVTVTAPPNGPQAVRSNGGLVFPDTTVQFGGFAVLFGSPSKASGSQTPKDNRDVYILGATSAGLQLARAPMDDIADPTAYTYYSPSNRTFGSIAPSINITNRPDIYLTGSFSSGTLFYSPYYTTFLLIYFNNFADNTFYVRYLDLTKPVDSTSKTWPAGGGNGTGITIDDAEAILYYSWSDEQVLFKTQPGPGGFNYAGAAHPEYFNRQYYPQSKFFYPSSQSLATRKGDWIGVSIVPADIVPDGNCLLLSWTEQLNGDLNAGIYQIQLAVIRFSPLENKNSSGNGTGFGAPQNDGRYPDGYFGPLKGFRLADVSRAKNHAFLKTVVGVVLSVGVILVGVLIWIGLTKS